MKLEKSSKLVMIGDSITDAGRAHPIGEGLSEALGRGYVTLVDALLGSVYPELGIRVINMGSSGNTVLDLQKRWQTDVLDLKPDWVSIMVGASDVWRQFDSPRQPEIHVLPDVYEKTLEELVAQTLPAVHQVVLMTPFYIEPNKADAMRSRMDEYGAIVKALAAKHGTLLVDTQAAFDDVLAHYYPATLGWDRVHPSQTGHMVLARAFLQAVDFRLVMGIVQSINSTQKAVGVYAAFFGPGAHCRSARLQPLACSACRACYSPVCRSSLCFQRLQ